MAKTLRTPSLVPTLRPSVLTHVSAGCPVQAERAQEGGVELPPDTALGREQNLFRVSSFLCGCNA